MLRVANQLTTALIGLKNATTTPATDNDIKDKVTNLNNLLGEALSVRLTKDQINNSTIQALALANIINKIDRRYSNAFGVGYDNDMSNTPISDTAMSDKNMSNNMNMMSMMKNDQPNSKK